MAGVEGRGKEEKGKGDCGIFSSNPHHLFLHLPRRLDLKVPIKSIGTIQALAPLTIYYHFWHKTVIVWTGRCMVYCQQMRKLQGKIDSCVRVSYCRHILNWNVSLFVWMNFQGKKRSSDILKKIEKGKYYNGERYLFNLLLSLKWVCSLIFFFSLVNLKDARYN